MDQHNKLMAGMVFGMLLPSIEKTQMTAPSIFSDLSIVVRDHYECLIQVLYIFVEECFLYMKDSTVNSIFWICENLILKDVQSLKSFLILLLK